MDKSLLEELLREAYSMGSHDGHPLTRSNKTFLQWLTDTLEQAAGSAVRHG